MLSSVVSIRKMLSVPERSDAARGRRPRRVAVRLLVLVLATSQTPGCDAVDPTSPASTPAAEATDTPTQDTRETSAARELAAPLRVVSLDPLATRFVEALGAGDQLVAVDSDSAKLPELGDRPIATLASAADFAPDLVLVSGRPLDDAPLRALQAAAIRVVELAPHDLEDVIALIRSLGAELSGRAAAARFEHALSRPLALIGGRSSPIDRPRVVVVTQLDPLELAGGHSFESDVVEIAGGTSLTHGGEDHRLPVTREALRALAPDLIVVSLEAEPDAARRAALRDQLPADLEVDFFTFDREGFWLDDPTAPVLRMQKLLLVPAREAARRHQSSGSTNGGASVRAISSRHRPSQ